MKKKDRKELNALKENLPNLTDAEMLRYKKLEKLWLQSFDKNWKKRL